MIEFSDETVKQMECFWFTSNPGITTVKYKLYVQWKNPSWKNLWNKTSEYELIGTQINDSEFRLSDISMASIRQLEQQFKRLNKNENNKT